MLNLTKGENGIMEERASLVAQSAQNAHETKLSIKRQNVTDIKMKLDKLNDIGPKDRMSLQPAGPDFNASEWVDEVQSLSEELIQAEFEFEVCEKNYKKYFGAIPTGDQSVAPKKRVRKPAEKK